MNSLALRSLQQMHVGLRGLSTTPQKFAAASFKPSPQFKKLKEVQERYQVPDGIPIHLKKGMFDKVLYHTTVLLCIVGLGMSGKFLFDQACPKK